jgi:hypothetical protein
LLLHVPLLQEVLGHRPCHLCDTLWWRVIELHNLVVHVFINVHNGCLVAAPARVHSSRLAQIQRQLLLLLHSIA